VFFEANVLVLDEKVFLQEDNARCKTLHDGSVKENGKILEDNGGIHEVEDVFLDEESNLLEEKVIVLSKHVEGGERNGNHPKGKDE